MHSFASEDITCPACKGKHRPHTYKEGCMKKKPSPVEEVPKESKTPKAEPTSAKTSESKEKPTTAETTARSVLKKIISPDTKSFFYHLTSKNLFRGCMRRGGAIDKGRTASRAPLVLGSGPTATVQTFCCGFLLGTSASAVVFIIWLFTL